VFIIAPGPELETSSDADTSEGARLKTGTSDTTVSEMNIDEKKYLSSTATAVAGCKPVTFRAWRRRHDLFRSSDHEGEGWNRFSLLEVCILRLVVVLTKHAIPIRTALLIAQAEETKLPQVLVGERDGILMFGQPRQSGRDMWMGWAEEHDTVMEVVALAAGAVTAIDLAKVVVEHVTNHPKIRNHR
jgi:hypothetical protein